MRRRIAYRVLQGLALICMALIPLALILSGLAILIDPEALVILGELFR